MVVRLRGGHLEAVWSFDGGRWTAQASGVAADGSIGTGTRILTQLGPDAYLLQSFHRVLDGEALPDDEVTVVRRPPAGEGEDSGDSAEANRSAGGPAASPSN